MTPSRFKNIIGLSLIIDIIILDQLSKWAVLELALRPNIDPSASPVGLTEWMMNAPARLPFTSIEILPFFNLVMVWNDGISFGMFGGIGPMILSALALIVSAIFLVWLVRATAWPQAIASAMIVGGALSNVLDRFRFGAVADFLDFHALGWHYPAFNLADSCITLGIVLLLFDSLFLEPRRQ